MQTVNLEDHINSPGWKVKHNENTHLFEVQAANGKYLQQAFTSRTLAEKYLYDYLDKHNRMAHLPRKERSDKGQSRSVNEKSTA